MLEQDPAVARGAGHHSVIYSAKDDQYHMVYHRRPLDKTGANDRVICVDEMKFDKEGHILPVKMTFNWTAK